MGTIYVIYLEFGSNSQKEKKVTGRELVSCFAKAVTHWLFHSICKHAHNWVLLNTLRVSGRTLGRNCLLRPSLALSPLLTLLEASVVGSLETKQEAKTLLPNSATYMHILMSNSAVEIKEWRTVFPGKIYTGMHNKNGLLYNS